MSKENIFSGTFIKYSGHSYRSIQIKIHGITKELNKEITDVYMWQEIDLCWSTFAKQDTWKVRTQRLYIHSNFAHNTTDI